MKYGVAKIFFLLIHRICVPFRALIILLLISFSVKVVHRLNISVQSLHFSSGKIAFCFFSTFHGSSYFICLENSINEIINIENKKTEFNSIYFSL